MDDYKTIQSYLSGHNLHHFTFDPQSDKPIKTVICHLSINTSSQELGYDVVSVKPLTWRFNNHNFPAPPSDLGTLSEVTVNLHPYQPP